MSNKPEQPPAAFSILTDEGLEQWQRWGCPKIEITIDGEVERHCYTYDTEAGWLDRYKTDGDGTMLINRERDDVVRERIHGKVGVRWQ